MMSRMARHAYRLKKNLFKVGQVIKRSKDDNNVVQVRVMTMKLDDYIHKYFYHPNDHWVLERDIPGPTKVGDLVLMEKLREPYTELIHYHIKDIVFKEGEVYDPVTGRRCRGKMYSDGGNINFNRLEEEKMHMMQMDGGEMYEGGAGDMGDDDRDDFVDDARLSRRQKKRMGISNSANIDEKRETEKEGHLDYVHWNEYDR